MKINIVIGDYSNKQQAKDIVPLLNHYALDAADGGIELSEYTQKHLVAELAKLPYCFTDKSDGLNNPQSQSVPRG